MNARIRMPQSKFRKDFIDDVLAEVKERTQEDQNKAILRTLKMACLVLHQEFGFGQARAEKFVGFMDDYGRQVADIPERWSYIDKVLKDKLGFDFDDEDIDERETHTRALYHEKGRKFREY